MSRGPNIMQELRCLSWGDIQITKVEGGILLFEG